MWLNRYVSFTFSISINKIRFWEFMWLIDTLLVYFRYKEKSDLGKDKGS